MDAGLLDVLHHAADDGVLAVGHHIHVDLDGIAQELVDQDGRALVALAAARGQALASTCLQGHADEGIQPGGVVHDLHGPAAEHVRGSHHDRISDLLGDHPRLFQAVRCAPDRRA